MKRLVICVCMLSGSVAWGAVLGDLLPGETIMANDGALQVPGYSVPAMYDWNNDGLADLTVGEGSGETPGKVRVYYNSGSETAPSFTDYSYLQDIGGDISVPAQGCLGSFPRAAYWDQDDLLDLIVGQADGTVSLFRNTGTLTDPSFGASETILVGFPGEPLDVGARATVTPVDWNSDGLLDLVVGAFDGKMHVYLDCGCSPTEPAFYTTLDPAGLPIEANNEDLVVPALRSSPVVMDLNGDGLQDILSGNTEGQLLLYTNTGSEMIPVFGTPEYLAVNGEVIDLPGTPRSRPFVTDYNGDGTLDILVGSADGQIQLFASVPEPTTVMLLGMGGLALMARRRQRA